MNREALSVLSLAMKAGKLVSGADPVLESLREGSAVLVILASDASFNTKKRFHDQCAFRCIELKEFSSRAELGRTIGKEMRSVIALKDEGFRTLFLNKLNVGE